MVRIGDRAAHASGDDLVKATAPRLPIALAAALMIALGCDRSGEAPPGLDAGMRPSPHATQAPSLAASEAESIPANDPASVAGPSVRRTVGPRLYNRVVALCVGVNDYSSPMIKNLSYAEPDATAVADRLRTLYGYETVVLLGREATRAAVEAKLREYAGRLGERDALIVYFAGHGQVIELPSHGRAGFLIPYDAELDLDDRTNPDDWRGQALEMRGLVEIVREMKAHHVLLIADACCSGFLTKRGEFAERKDLHLLLAEPSRVVLAAATENQGAGENWKTGHGFFTGALLDQLERSEAASVTDVFVEVRRRVSRESKSMLPQMANLGDGDGEFVFIPLEVPERDIQVALEGGLEHALKGVHERSMRRIAQMTRIEDVYEAFEASDYRFSSQPREREKLWRDKVERFRENAARGDVLAMAGLHYCYSKGLGVEKDGGQALHWAQLAYDSGRPAGKHVLGRCLLNGVGVEKNEEAAWRLIGEAADAGFAVSRLSLADRDLKAMERTGRFEADRVAHAHDLAEKAAAAGLAKAREQLALLYLFVGELPGVRRDVKRAIELLEAATETGLPSAQAELAKVYTGQLSETPKDLDKARKLLTQAAEAGHATSQHVLAGEYLQDEEAGAALGLQRDDDRARRFFELAAAQDFTPSLLALCRMYQPGTATRPDPKKAREYCERAAELNDPGAFVIQGTWHANGIVYEQDDLRAIELFRRAAVMSHPVGCRMLGWMYEQARGVPLGGHPQREMIPYFKYHALHWHVQAVKLGDDPESKQALDAFHKDVRAERNLAKLGVPYADLVTPWPSRILAEFRKEYPESAEAFDRMYEN